jgi:hypothetical protein
MSDEALLLFGCTVSFIALAGAYVGLRHRFLDRDDDPAVAEGPVRMPPGKPVPVPVRAIPRSASVRVRS